MEFHKIIIKIYRFSDLLRERSRGDLDLDRLRESRSFERLRDFDRLFERELRRRRERLRERERLERDLLDERDLPRPVFV